MFDLEHEIAEWRRVMARDGVDSPAILDELESHLRDYIDEQVRHGGDTAVAFQRSVARIGDAQILRREFRRAKRVAHAERLADFCADPRKGTWGACAIALFVGLGNYLWHIRVTPIYAAVSTIHVEEPFGMNQVMRSRSPSSGIRAQEDLNAVMKILMSARFQQQVMGSFTPRELAIIRRTSSKHDVSGEIPPMREALGTLNLAARRSTCMLTLTVQHEDTHAAALVANRYVELLRAKYPGTPEHPVFRDIEVATPPTKPVRPDVRLVRHGSIALAAITFSSVIIVAAFLGHFLRRRPTRDSEVTVS